MVSLKSGMVFGGGLISLISPGDVHLHVAPKYRLKLRKASRRGGCSRSGDSGGGDGRSGDGSGDVSRHSLAPLLVVAHLVARHSRQSRRPRVARRSCLRCTRQRRWYCRQWPLQWQRRWQRRWQQWWQRRRRLRLSHASATASSWSASAISSASSISSRSTTSSSAPSSSPQKAYSSSAMQPPHVAAAGVGGVCSPCAAAVPLMAAPASSVLPAVRGTYGCMRHLLRILTASPNGIYTTFFWYIPLFD